MNDLLIVVCQRTVRLDITVDKTLDGLIGCLTVRNERIEMDGSVELGIHLSRDNLLLSLA